MTFIQRSRLRATSGIDSRSPRGEAVWSTNIALPPRVFIAVSNVRRVRSEAFSKNITICLASSAWRKSSGCFLTACASSMSAAISCTERSAMEQRSRPARPLAASVKALSDWMPRVTVGFGASVSGAFITRVLLAMYCFSRQSCAGVGVKREQLVDCGDSLVDVLARDEERGEEAENGFVRAVDDDAAFQQAGRERFGEFGRLDFDADHQAETADFFDRCVLRLQAAKLREKIIAGLADVREQAGVLDLVDHCDSHRTSQRISAEGCAVHAGCDGAGGFFGAEHRAHGDAAGEWLCQRSDVGLDVEVLVSRPLAGAAHAGLDFVEEQQRAGGVAQFASGGEKLLRAEVDAALALDHFESDSAHVSGERGAQCGGVVEGNELDVGHNGSEGRAVLLF